MSGFLESVLANLMEKEIADKLDNIQNQFPNDKITILLSPAVIGQGGFEYHGATILADRRIKDDEAYFIPESISEDLLKAIEIRYGKEGESE